MIKYLLLVVVMLVGCTSAPNLPPTDTIVAVKPVDSGIIASSAKYSYRFFRTGFPKNISVIRHFMNVFTSRLLACGLTLLSINMK